MLLGRALVLIFLYLNGSLTEAKNKTLKLVPRKIHDGSKYIWPWKSTGEWTKNEGPGLRKPVYSVCDIKPSVEPNFWLRSHRNHVKNATRVDVTLKYAVTECRADFKHCKDNLQLFVHKTLKRYNNIQNKVPEPNVNIGSYRKFGTTKPRSMSQNLDKINNETYSFFTNRSIPYFYLAIRYQGGCFRLFEVILSYSFCSSMALSSNLVHLTETIAPANGTIQVGGSCAQNAQPLADNMTLYGNCMANGEWSSDAIGGECLCMAGFGKYLNGTSASCKKCPDGTYQDTASNASCTKCPLNSRVNSNRTMCSCKPGYYRFDNETYMDTCTGPPSKPRFPEAPFINATSLQLSWSSPSDLGSRSDVYYEIHCKKCNDEGKDCITNCTGANISHTPRTSRNATVQFLSPYTYYEFKIFAKNGMSSLAEIRDNREPQFIPLPRRTKQSVPGVPTELSAEISSTEIKLRWKLEKKNGVITYYQVTYHEENKEENTLTKNTTKTSITIKSLKPQKTYIFKIRASTKEGFGKPAFFKTKLTSKKKDGKKKPGAVPIKKELLIAIVVGVLVLLVFIIVLLIVCIYKRSNSYNTNFHDVHTIEDWLGSINMARYATHFANAGYMDLGHVKSLEEEDLSRIGVKLIGHRNKINKSIKAMNKHFESLESDDSEKQTFV